ncbi:MAG TPA: DUF222 domain-containing protein [Streptosporangiaceae bacterium]|nr:DUF222 domain-containing protein [Streptosporangiaceae bacterium]
MTVPASASLSEALELACAALRVAAAADPAGQPAEVQGRCLQLAEQAAGIGTAAQARILAAFTAGQGYTADACYGAVPWLMVQTGVTKGAARGHVGWARRATAHPEVTAALAEGTVLSESMARTICRWTGRLPEDCRPSADAILVAAARAGAREDDLAALAAEIYARSLPPDGDGPDEGFAERSVRLETTFEGAGVLAGELTAECAALVGAVLDALGAPAGAGDLRTHDQRYHDALQEAMRRLAASDLLPERAGQPVKALVHVSLAELRAMDADTVLEEEWITAVRGRWAAARAAASVGGSDGGAWLGGDAARGVSCDAMLVPVVTGEVDPGALEDLLQLCVTLAGHHGPGACGHHSEPGDPAGQGQAGHGGLGEPGPADDRGQAGDPAGHDRSGPACCAGAAPLTAHAREMLERQIISRAVDLVSGPGGLASFLRRQQLGARLAGPSLPLDIGYADTVPAGIRTAVILRDQHCQWTGGCTQPAAACEVHHVRHKADGGPTSVKDCILLCWFHHQVVIHRWGWTLILHPDGTTTAWNRDKTKVLRSHSPPSRPG